MSLARRTSCFAWLALTVSCADLPEILAGTCGNSVVEPPEDCDTFTIRPTEVCRPKGSAGECHFDCRARNDGTRPSCPAGWGCDIEGICRPPTGEFGAPVEFKVGGASSLLTGDFDGDGRGDIVSREPLDAYGRSRLRFHYFDERGALVDTKLFPKLVASPAIADLSGDGRSDLVSTDFRVSLLLGQADRSLVPETFGSYHIRRAKIRMVAVYDDFVAQETAIFAVTTLNGAPGYYFPDAAGVLRLRGALPGPFESLAGDPVDGDVFDDPRDSPCRELIAATLGATTFSILDVCARSAETGAVMWREIGLATTVALIPPAPIDTAPLAADIDVDGHVDVLVRAGGQVYMARSDGQHLSAAVPYRLALLNDSEIAPDIPMPLAAGDFTGDGAADFVFADRLLTSNRVPGSPLPRYEIAHFNLGAPWTAAKIADLNGNGKLDVIAGSSGRLGIDFFNGTGTLHLTDFSIATSGPIADLAVGDFDGDLISDLAFIETAASTGDRDTVAVSFGQLAGPPLAPTPVARVASTEKLCAFTGAARSDLIVSSAGEVDGEEGGILTLLAGSGDRLPLASLGLTNISPDGQLTNPAALGLSLGSLTTSGHHDLLAFATNDDVSMKDWQVWLVPGVDRPNSRPRRLDWKLDAKLLPAYLHGSEAAAISWVGGAADVDRDGLEDAVWVMPNADLQHCAVVVIGAAPDTETLTVRTTVELDEPCRGAALELPDADGDGSPDIALLTDAPGSTARKLLVLWNQGQGRFSSEVASQLNPSTESPQAFTFLSPIPERAGAFAYVTDSSVVLVESKARREFAPRVLAPIVRGSGIVAADVNGDRAADLVVAASGHLVVMKAVLRTR